jgi:rhodanese-related sulfurtransferase
VTDTGDRGWEVMPEEVAGRLLAGVRMVLLDVRSASEYGAYHIPGSIHIPIDELAARHPERDLNPLPALHGLRRVRQYAAGHERVARAGGGDDATMVDG